LCAAFFMILKRLRPIGRRERSAFCARVNDRRRDRVIRNNYFSMSTLPFRKDLSILAVGGPHVRIQIQGEPRKKSHTEPRERGFPGERSRKT